MNPTRGKIWSGTALGSLGFVLASACLFDSPFQKRPGRIDSWGLGLMIVGFGCLQLVLDRGEREQLLGVFEESGDAGRDPVRKATVEGAGRPIDVGRQGGKGGLEIVAEEQTVVVLFGFQISAIPGRRLGEPKLSTDELGLGRLRTDGRER